VYFLKCKSETYEKFRNFHRKIEKETGNKLHVQRTDRGGKYLSETFTNYCKENGINQELNQARTPQQNGISKRRNRTIIERTKSISTDCGLPTYLWMDVVSHATYLINRSPTRANAGETPEKMYLGMTPDVSNLKIFGCLAYVHVPKEQRNKLDSKTLACLFLGFDSESKAFRLYDQNRKKVLISCDVVFDEMSQLQFLIFLVYLKNRTEVCF